MKLFCLKKLSFKSPEPLSLNPKFRFNYGTPFFIIEKFSSLANLSPTSKKNLQKKMFVWCVLVLLNKFDMKKKGEHLKLHFLDTIKKTFESIFFGKKFSTQFQFCICTNYYGNNEKCEFLKSLWWFSFIDELW